MSEKVHLESVIKDIGGCGKYQILLSIIIHSMKTAVCFSTIAMVFGAAVPDWWCVEDLPPGNMTLTSTALNGTTFKACETSSGARCTKFYFSDDINTVVNEWGLVCDMNWVPSTTVSIQMAGVLLGNIASGQVADSIGRKPPFYISMAILTAFNLIAAFSVNWIMFAVVRFMIGIGIGFFLTVQYNIQSEFTLVRWRTIVVAFSSWALEVSLYALVVYIIKDWKIIHFVTAALSFLYMFTWWFVPESFRWYMAHDRARDAQIVISKVARFNGRPDPNMETLRRLADNEIETARKGMKYTMLDLFRSKYLRKITLLLMIDWVALGMVAYGIQFGVHALSGNLYVNIFLFGIVLSPIYFLCMYLNNRFGRQRTALMAFVLTAVASAIVGIIQRINMDEDLRGILTNAFSLIAYIGIDFGWPPMQTLTLEIYPTVVRNIGYGFQNMLARVGAIIGPQLIFLDAKAPGLMYFVCAIVAALCVIATVPVPETKDRDLKDKMVEVTVSSDDSSYTSKDDATAEVHKV